MSVVELARRVEALEGPDRGVDALIAAHQIKDIERCRFPSIEQWVRAALQNNWNFPRVTNSLDAAMKLVPKGWEWTLFHGGVVSLKPDVAFCRHRETDTGTRADAATPALALTAAALRAMIAKAVEEGGD